MEPYITFSFKEGDESPQILAIQSVEGNPHYDFELSAWHKKDYQCNFEIRSVPTLGKPKEKSLYLPCSALPELRKKMVKILAEHDGSERIDKMPKIPEWTRGFSKFTFILFTLIHHHQSAAPNVGAEKNADDEVSYSFHPILLT
jgi:hypothetical protein